MMKPKVFIRILIFCFSLECYVIAEKIDLMELIGIEKDKDEILPLSNNSSGQTFPGNTFGKNCSNAITISSDGPTCRFQEYVLGTYVINITSKIVMANLENRFSVVQRFLYRCPWAKGSSYDCWLFGKSNGNDVGWIKHENCIGCPETCSQDWMYWNDDVKQWHYDRQILITTDHSKHTCPDTEVSSSFNWWNLMYILPVLVGLILMAPGICKILICRTGSSRGGKRSSYGGVRFSLDLGGGGDGWGGDFD